MAAAMTRANHRVVVAASIVAAFTQLSACQTPPRNGGADGSTSEVIYVLRSIREAKAPDVDLCVSSRTGFEPFATDAERSFSFWSVRSKSEDGRIVDAMQSRVAELRACFGATPERARQNFYAEIDLGGMSFHGSGECLALMTDFPEPGLFPVRCQLTLSGLPAPFVGGFLTTNTITSSARFGGKTDPPGYTQASIATIRLWKK
jgi:uncharacterized membrane protein